LLLGGLLEIWLWSFFKLRLKKLSLVCRSFTGPAVSAGVSVERGGHLVEDRLL